MTTGEQKEARTFDKGVFSSTENDVQRRVPARPGPNVQERNI